MELRWVALGALTAAGAAWACGSGATAPAAEARPAQLPDPCAVQEGGPPAPVTDPSGPYYHSVMVARTSDGRTLGPARRILEHASVPDGVLTADGTVLVYYVNGAQGYLWVARLENDSTALPLGPIRLGGTDRPRGVVDPDAWRMPDGTIRLAYLSGFASASSGVSRAICIAESRDGRSFTVLGAALEAQGAEQFWDPSVVRLPDGTWRMAVSLGQSTLMTRSTDGVKFTRMGVHAFGGVPELALTSDGALRIYVCAAGIVSWRSTDGGQTWTQEGVVVPPGGAGQRVVCDPSLVAGAGVFLYKVAP